MKKLRVYVDTSVISFLFADDAPDFRAITVGFFDRRTAKYELYVSDVVLKEIANDPVAEHRNRLLAVLASHRCTVLPDVLDAEVGRLADSYIDQGVVSLAKRNDALHVAYATVFEMDVLLSWNFRHLANIRKEARFVAANQVNGYLHSPRIVSPLEMEDDDTE